MNKEEAFKILEDNFYAAMVQAALKKENMIEVSPLADLYNVGCFLLDEVKRLEAALAKKS